MNSAFSVDESVLIDLKHLLLEAKQNLPPFLVALESESENLAQYGGTSLASFYSCFYFHFSFSIFTYPIVIPTVLMNDEEATSTFMKFHILEQRRK